MLFFSYSQAFPSFPAFQAFPIRLGDASAKYKAGLTSLRILIPHRLQRASTTPVRFSSPARSASTATKRFRSNHGSSASTVTPFPSSPTVSSYLRLLKLVRRKDLNSVMLGSASPATSLQPSPWPLLLATSQSPALVRNFKFRHASLCVACDKPATTS